MSNFRFKCDICNTNYKSAVSLQRHTKLTHAEEEKIYKCNNCEFQSIHKYSFTRHHKNPCTKIIGSDSKFKCEAPNCDKEFDTKNSLRGHTRYSHKLVEFKCPKCEKTFTTNQTLRQHMEASHEDKKYPCGKCDYQAKYQQNLRKHEKSVHFGVKHPCTFCPYRATDKQHLKKHIKLIHEDGRLRKSQIKGKNKNVICVRLNVTAKAYKESIPN